MKAIIKVSIFIIFLTLFSSFPFVSAADSEPDQKGNFLQIQILDIKGDVEIIRETQADPIAASQDMPLEMGDFLATGYKSECTLIIEKTAQVKIDSLTNIIINECFLKDNLAQTSIKLRMGSMTSKVTPEHGIKAKFSIKTPTSTVGVRGTENHVAEAFGFGTKVTGFSGTTELISKLGQKEQIRKKDVASVMQSDQQITTGRNYFVNRATVITADLGRTADEVDALLDTPTAQFSLPPQEFKEILELKQIPKASFELNWSIETYR